MTPYSSLTTPSEISGATLLGTEPITTEHLPLGKTFNHITARGQDFAVYCSGHFVANEQGKVCPVITNSFTVLETGLNYKDAQGEWQPSRDLIESSPEGAVSRHGPNKIIFSRDLNSRVVFALETSTGDRICGGVRQIQLTDYATGKSVVIGTVKRSAPANLFPPNKIVWVEGFDGIAADLVCIARHDMFCHDIVLREQPLLPEGMSPDTTCLEVVTEFLDSDEPILEAHSSPQKNGLNIIDHTFIRFGGADMIMGKALPVQDAAMIDHSGPSASDTPVVKQWHALADGRRFLVESVDWNSFKKASENLPVQQGGSTINDSRIKAARSWPTQPRLTIREAVQPALVEDYTPCGFLVDFVVIPASLGPTTFASGTTYYIPKSYYSGSHITFEPGCVIKYKNNANMLLYGQVTFPDTHLPVVFTSRNDDMFGDRITGMSMPGEKDSDGAASLHLAAQQLWIYYMTSSTTIKNARFRWARRGIQYDQNPGVTVSHIANNLLFEHFTSPRSYAIHVNMPDASLNLSEVRKHHVITPSNTVAGSISGTISEQPYLTDLQFMGWQRSEDPDNLGAQPDPMGAVGPSHFVELLNFKMRVFNKLGETLESFDASEIFDPEIGGQSFDPRIIYDALAGQWIAVALKKADRTLRLAYTTGTNPLKANWFLLVIDLGANTAGLNIDWPTLGVDKNGVYVAVHFLNTSPNTTSALQKIVAIKKIDGQLSTNPEEQTIIVKNDPYKRTIWQPVVNFDPDLTPGAYAWFITKNDLGDIHSGYLQWRFNSGTGHWNATFTDSKTDSSPNPYEDLDYPVNVFNAYQKNGDASAPLSLQGKGSRIQNSAYATIIHGTSYIWACHTVGVNSSNGRAGADRAAVQWLQLRVNDTYLSIADQGRIYDDSGNPNPGYFFNPSLAVDNAGNMVVGFAVSRATEYVGAAYIGKNYQSRPTKPELIQSGKGYFNYLYWGDYSHTTLDPNDSSFWTVHQFALPALNSQAQYGTIITKIEKR